MLVAVLAAAGYAALPGCSRSSGAAAPSPQPVESNHTPSPLEVTVTQDGFVPANLHVNVGQPVILRVTRKVDRTCATDIVIKEYGISRPLPKDEPVEVTFTPSKPGTIRYSCAMDMVSGQMVAD